MNITVYSTIGKTLSPWPFQVKLGEPNLPLLAQAIRIYQANSHQGGSRVKTRGEVAGSTRKIYRQKGTGRARHGARKAPLFVGGGVAHGPTGLRPARLVLPKQMRRAALASVLALKLANHSLLGISQASRLTGKTSSLVSLLHAACDYPRRTTLLLTSSSLPVLYRSAANLQGIQVKRVSLTSFYDLFQADFILVTKPALANLLSRATNQNINSKS